MEIFLKLRIRIFEYFLCQRSVKIARLQINGKSQDALKICITLVIKALGFPHALLYKVRGGCKAQKEDSNSVTEPQLRVNYFEIRKIF